MLDRQSLHGAFDEAAFNRLFRWRLASLAMLLKLH